MLEVIKLKGQLVVDSRIIAQELGITAKSFHETIRKNMSDLEQFGTVPFQTAGLNGSSNYQTWYLLNEEQANLMLMSSRSTDEVKALRVKFVKAFSEAKRIIAEQAARIAEQDAYIVQLEQQLRHASNVFEHTLDMLEETVAATGWYSSSLLKKLNAAFVEYYKHNDKMLKLSGIPCGANKKEVQHRANVRVDEGRKRFIVRYCHITDTKNHANVTRVLNIWDALNECMNGISPDDLRDAWVDMEKWQELLASIGYNDERDDFDFADDEQDLE